MGIQVCSIKGFAPLKGEIIKSERNCHLDFFNTILFSRVTRLVQSSLTTVNILKGGGSPYLSLIVDINQISNFQNSGGTVSTRNHNYLLLTGQMIMLCTCTRSFQDNLDMVLLEPLYRPLRYGDKSE